MTREEAVLMLTRLEKGCDEYAGLTNYAKEAVQMAITALQTDGDCISKQTVFETAAEYENELREILGDENELVEVVKILKHRLLALPSVQPEPKEIDYTDCANAMMKMWMDNVLTDGEYSQIMDKLNAHWAERREE